MRVVGACLLLVLFVAIAPPAYATDVYTTGIAAEGGDAGVTFSDFGAGDITTLDSSGRRIDNDSAPTSAQTAYIEFEFDDGFQGMTSATTGWVWVLITRDQWNNLANSITITEINGNAANLGSSTSRSLIRGGSLHNYKLYFTLTGALTVSTITIQFNLESNGAAAINIDTVGNPEPSTFALFGLGLLGTGFWIRRRRKRAA